MTTNKEAKLAQDIAEQIKEACWAKRQAFHTDMVSVEDAVREAIATEEGPVLLGDIADSGGAGTPGDGTAILAELIKQKARGAVIGNIADCSGSARGSEGRDWKRRHSHGWRKNG